MRRGAAHKGTVWGLAIAAIVVAGMARPAPAASATSADQAGKLVAKSFGVQVLKVRPAKIDGRQVFLVTVMNPKGDFNEAFQVSTVMVDAATGKLVSGFRHRASGLNSNQAPSYIPNRQQSDSLRQDFTWR